MTRYRAIYRTLLLSVLSVAAMLYSAVIVMAEPPYSIAWSRQIGTSSNDSSSSVAVDPVGNAYISGTTLSNLGGPSAGNYDAFLAKYNSAGSLVWTQQIGTSDIDYSSSVAVDASGNAFISGQTFGSLGGPSAGDSDAFLIKYDSSGSVLWSRQIGTSESDYSSSVAVDLYGNAYISGTTSGSLAGPYQGFQDAFLTKFDGSGNLLWSRQIGASDEDRSTSVAVDASGNPYISGFTRNSLGGPNAGGFDAFLMKFDAAGNTLWSRQIGTTGSGAADDSSSIALDSLGNAYISGDTSGSLAAPSAGGGGDAILIKYDSAGNLLWSRQIGTTNYDQSSAVAVDAAGNAYISGISGGSLGGPNAGFYDAFLFKYDGAGNVLWSRQIGTSDYDYSGSIAVDGAGNAFISGQTYGSLGGPSAGDADAFLIKFAVPEPANLMLIGLCLQFLMWRNLRPLFSSKSCGKSSID